MSYIVVDVESDGEIPHKYSMVSFGAVVVEPSLSKTFYGKTKPISDIWVPEAEKNERPYADWAAIEVALTKMGLL